MAQQIALYLKMIAYYEQKLETIKQTLISNNEDNIRGAFNLIACTEQVITKNALLSFFVGNLQTVNYKDVVELIWFIGDKDNFTINLQQFQDYLTQMIMHKITTKIEHSQNDIQSQLSKLLMQQIRVIKQVRESKLQIINSDTFNLHQVFQQMSNDGELITSTTLLNYMKKEKVQFNNFDYDLLTFAIFGRKCNINFEMFKDLFSNKISVQRVVLRQIPDESFMQNSYIVNLAKSIIQQQQQLMPISEASSVVEFKTSDVKPKTKAYQEQTYIPKPY